MNSVINRRHFLLWAAAMLAAPAAMAQDQTDSITSIAPRAAMQGKLATRTEIVSHRGEPAMVTLSSRQAMQGAIDYYREIVANGGWPSVPRGKLEPKVRAARVVALRQRMAAEGYLDPATLDGPDADLFDARMASAVRAFQRNHGIATTGIIGDRTRFELNITARARLHTLEVNLPRVAEYLTGLGPRNILVNIPSAQLESVEFGRVFARHNVVVGKLDRPTPTLKSKVTTVNFNPYWTAPASIVEKDIVPKYLKDPTYLRQMNIRIFDGLGGPEIDPATVDWMNTAPDRYVFRQEPGEHNALATVKINFHNKYSVYMHDTPHRELFGANARYESSGCVRVDQVKTLVNWIIGDDGGYDEASFDMITASQEPYELPVKSAPDVRFMYLTAWVTDDGRVNFRPDIYQLDNTGFVLGQPAPAETEPPPPPAH